MPSNRYLTLANLVCASCVLHLDIVNLFLQHVHPYPPGFDRYDNFLLFDAPLLLCALYSVQLLALYAFAHKYNWQVWIAILFELIHFGMSIWDASQFFCLYHPTGSPLNCFNVKRFIMSLCNIVFLAGGLTSQSVSLYRERCTATSDTDKELLIIYDSN